MTATLGIDINGFYGAKTPPSLSRQPQWTGDDSIMARNVTNEVHFYKSSELVAAPLHTRVQPKLRDFALSPSTSSPHLVVFFTPSEWGGSWLEVWAVCVWREGGREGGCVFV